MEITLLKFEASWCQPCKVLNVFYEEIKNEFKTNVNYFSYDQEKDAALFEIHSVHSCSYYYYFRS
jgi:thiol-disulfide isomerase/thioredoxin